MQQSDFPQYVCKFMFQNGALWDIILVHCEIYVMGIPFP